MSSVSNNTELFRQIYVQAAVKDAHHPLARWQVMEAANAVTNNGTGNNTIDTDIQTKIEKNDQIGVIRTLAQVFSSAVKEVVNNHTITHKNDAKVCCEIGQILRSTPGLSQREVVSITKDLHTVMGLMARTVDTTAIALGRCVSCCAKKQTQNDALASWLIRHEKTFSFGACKNQHELMELRKLLVLAYTELDDIRSDEKTLKEYQFKVAQQFINECKRLRQLLPFYEYVEEKRLQKEQGKMLVTGWDGMFSEEKPSQPEKSSQTDQDETSQPYHPSLAPKEETSPTSSTLPSNPPAASPSSQPAKDTQKKEEFLPFENVPGSKNLSPEEFFESLESSADEESPNKTSEEESKHEAPLPEEPKKQLETGVVAPQVTTQENVLTTQNPKELDPKATDVVIKEEAPASTVPVPPTVVPATEQPRVRISPENVRAWFCNLAANLALENDTSIQDLLKNSFPRSLTWENDNLEPRIQLYTYAKQMANQSNRFMKAQGRLIVEHMRAYIEALASTNTSAQPTLR
jgi:hypothetical protein